MAASLPTILIGNALTSLLGGYARKRREQEQQGIAQYEQLVDQAAKTGNVQGLQVLLKDKKFSKQAWGNEGDVIAQAYLGQANQMAQMNQKLAALRSKYPNMATDPNQASAFYADALGLGPIAAQEVLPMVQGAQRTAGQVASANTRSQAQVAAAGLRGQAQETAAQIRANASTANANKKIQAQQGLEAQREKAAKDLELMKEKSKQLLQQGKLKQAQALASKSWLTSATSTLKDWDRDFQKTVQASKSDEWGDISDPNSLASSAREGWYNRGVNAISDLILRDPNIAAPSAPINENSLSKAFSKALNKVGNSLVVIGPDGKPSTLAQFKKAYAKNPKAMGAMRAYLEKLQQDAIQASMGKLAQNAPSNPAFGESSNEE